MASRREFSAARVLQQRPGKRLYVIRTKSISSVDNQECAMTTAPAVPQPERKRGSGVKMVYDVLRDEILDLTLAPGSPIDEVQLAERFAMSRTPIREALVRLSGEGLVDTLPNRSTMVAPIDFLKLNTFFEAITLMYRVTTRLAAQHHKPADLVTIRALQVEFAAAVAAQDALGMIATNRAFHAAIAEAGRNPYFTALFCRLLDEGRRILRLYYQSFDDRLPQVYVEEHDAMIAAIAARDTEAADRLAKAHADQIVRNIQSLIARDDRQDIAL
jgi:DNA-binding GntR family transcriptional regulator